MWNNGYNHDKPVSHQFDHYSNFQNDRFGRINIDNKW